MGVEHAVDLDTGAVIAAELHPADQGDTTTLPATLRAAEANRAALVAPPTPETPAECITDKGSFVRAVLKWLEDGAWKTRIAEPKGKAFALERRQRRPPDRLQQPGGDCYREWRRQLSNSVQRWSSAASPMSSQALPDPCHRPYLGLLARLMIGAGIPKEAIARGNASALLVPLPDGSVLVLLVAIAGDHAFIVAIFARSSGSRRKSSSSTGC